MSKLSNINRSVKALTEELNEDVSLQPCLLKACPVCHTRLLAEYQNCPNCGQSVVVEEKESLKEDE